MTPLRIQFDSVRKHRNAREYHTIPRATCEGVEVTGHGMLLPRLAKEMVAAGYDPLRTADVYRGQTPVFSAHTLEEWASGKVGKGEQPAHFVKDAHP